MAVEPSRRRSERRRALARRSARSWPRPQRCSAMLARVGARGLIGAASARRRVNRWFARLARERRCWSHEQTGRRSALCAAPWRRRPARRLTRRSCAELPRRHRCCRRRDQWCARARRPASPSPSAGPRTWRRRRSRQCRSARAAASESSPTASPSAVTGRREKSRACPRTMPALAPMLATSLSFAPRGTILESRTSTPTALHHIRTTPQAAAAARVGVGGPVGSGKTTLVEMLCKAMRDATTSSSSPTTSTPRKTSAC